MGVEILTNWLFAQSVAAESPERVNFKCECPICGLPLNIVWGRHSEEHRMAHKYTTVGNIPCRYSWVTWTGATRTECHERFLEETQAVK